MQRSGYRPLSLEEERATCMSVFVNWIGISIPLLSRDIITKVYKTPLTWSIVLPAALSTQKQKRRDVGCCALIGPCLLFYLLRIGYVLKSFQRLLDVARIGVS